MSKDILKSLIIQFDSLKEPKRHIAAFEFVRDLAYGNIGSRDPYDVLEAKKGTCSGKHALLKLLLETLGYEVQSWFAKHSFGKFPISEWPKKLERFKRRQITDYHDFLKVKIGDEWV